MLYQSLIHVKSQVKYQNSNVHVLIPNERGRRRGRRMGGEWEERGRRFSISLAYASSQSGLTMNTSLLLTRSRLILPSLNIFNIKQHINYNKPHHKLTMCVTSLLSLFKTCDV